MYTINQYYTLDTKERPNVIVSPSLSHTLSLFNGSHSYENATETPLLARQALGSSLEVLLPLLPAWEDQ